MKYFLFAGNRANLTDNFRNLLNEVGGAQDLIGAYDEVSDATVFAAVLEHIRLGYIEYEDRIWVNALSIQPHNLGSTLEWAIRVGQSLDDPALHNCSLKKEVSGLGACGIVYMDCSILRNWHTG